MPIDFNQPEHQTVREQFRQDAEAKRAEVLSKVQPPKTEKPAPSEGEPK